MTATDPPLDPGPLFDLGMGFWVSKTLFSAIELGLFGALAHGPAPEADLGRRLGLAERPAGLLIDACVSLGLVERTDHGVRNAPLADAYLVDGRPGSLADLFRMFDARLYPRWARLGECLRRDAPAVAIEAGQESDLGRISPEQMAAFTRAMDAASAGPARCLPRVFSFDPYRFMADLGGGSGIYTIEAVQAFPHLRAVICERSAAVPVARGYVERAGVQDRVSVEARDFDAEPLPAGIDLAVLSQVVHGRGPEANRELFRKVHDHLPPAGGIVVCEWLLHADHGGPTPACLMALNMLVETPGGRQYSARELGQLLRDAGFREIQTRPLTGPAGFVSACK